MMFRRQPVVLTQQRTEYVTRTVQEHRAPTDDSVKLLREMEDKAEQQVVQSVRVGDTAFDCVIHLSHDMLSMKNKMRVIFSLGGRQMHEDVVCEHVDDGPTMLGKLRDAVARRVANEILGPALSRLSSIEWRRFSA